MRRKSVEPDDLFGLFTRMLGLGMTSRSTRRRFDERARVLPALLFALVWLFGYEVLPFAHQAMHAQLGAHSHGAAAAHCHGDYCHSDQGADRKAPSHDPSHGQGSLEHRGLAALAHEITLFVPELTLAGEQPIEVVLAARVTCFELRSPPVRGPPV